MKSPSTLVVLTLLAAATAACQKSAAPVAEATDAPISEADAGKLADATAATWGSMDAAKIKAMYAPNVTGFDYAIAPLAMDRAAWDKAQDGYAATKIDKVEQKERKIQILDADTFVVSGTWAGTSTAIPVNSGLFRCTDVYQKSADGAWSIVNEHCSGVPKPA